MRKYFAAALIGSLLFISACTRTPSNAVVTDSIKKIMPSDFEIVSVEPLKEVPGLLEVTVKMNKQPVILYMDKKAKYVLSGSLIHVESKKNLTIEAQGKVK